MSTLLSFRLRRGNRRGLPFLLGAVVIAGCGSSAAGNGVDGGADSNSGSDAVTHPGDATSHDAHVAKDTGSDIGVTAHDSAPEATTAPSDATQEATTTVLSDAAKASDGSSSDGHASDGHASDAHESDAHTGDAGRDAAPACSPSCPDDSACEVGAQCASGVCTAGKCAPPACSPSCPEGNACGASTDCVSGVCTSGTCGAAACAPSCPDGNECGAATDCASGVCTAGKCVPPACGSSCPDGNVCGAAGDCASGVCTAGKCVAPACQPTCADGKVCGAAGDCASGVCTNGLCAPPTCAPGCTNGAACGAASDCASLDCAANVCAACTTDQSCVTSNTCAGGACATCGSSLAGAGLENFTITFTLATTAAVESAVLGQRAACSNGLMWDIRMNATGQLVLEFDNNSSPYTTFTTVKSVNDGNAHTVVVARRGGLVSVSIDGTVDTSGVVADQPFTTLPPLTTGTDVCDGVDQTVALVGTVTDVCIALAPDPAWTVNGTYLTVNKPTASTLFSANDCDKTSFAMTPATVAMVPYDVGSSTPPQIAALPEGTATVPMPNGGATIVNNVFMILPGGRGTDLPFEVTFNYVDGTTAPAGTITIPHDCGGGGPLTAGTTTFTSQGTYTTIDGTDVCCENWWEASIGNPSPATQVTSLTVFYSPANNATWGFGRVWAVTID